MVVVVVGDRGAAGVDPLGTLASEFLAHALPMSALSTVPAAFQALDEAPDDVRGGRISLQLLDHLHLGSVRAEELAEGAAQALDVHLGKLRALEADPDVEAVVELTTLQRGPRRILVLVDVDFTDHLDTGGAHIVEQLVGDVIRANGNTRSDQQ